MMQYDKGYDRTSMDLRRDISPRIRVGEVSVEGIVRKLGSESCIEFDRRG